MTGMGGGSNSKGWRENLVLVRMYSIVVKQWQRRQDHFDAKKCPNCDMICGTSHWTSKFVVPVGNGFFDVELCQRTQRLEATVPENG